MLKTVSFNKRSEFRTICGRPKVEEEEGERKKRRRKRKEQEDKGKGKKGEKEEAMIVEMFTCFLFSLFSRLFSFLLSTKRHRDDVTPGCIQTSK